MKIQLLWDMNSCSLLYRYRRFGTVCCLQLPGSPRRVCGIETYSGRH